jgi:hypothetical protein
MVFYISARGHVGFSIYSEDNEITLGVPNFDIKVPIETMIETRNFNDKVSYYGKIKFETDNEIVIKDKIAYIR